MRWLVSIHTDTDCDVSSWTTGNTHSYILLCYNNMMNLHGGDYVMNRVHAVYV